MTHGYVQQNATSFSLRSFFFLGRAGLCKKMGGGLGEGRRGGGVGRERERERLLGVMVFPERNQVLPANFVYATAFVYFRRARSTWHELKAEFPEARIREAASTRHLAENKETQLQAFSNIHQFFRLI
jgi:hypothetical protein